MKYRGRQKDINKKAKACCESLCEALKENPGKQVQGVPGLKYHTHDVGDDKYFSLIHDRSQKFLLRPIKVHKVRDTADLAAHHLRGYNFAGEPEDMAQHTNIIHKALKNFQSDVDRVNKEEVKRQEIKKKQLKQPKKKKKK
jgi:hypothetical protein